MVRLEPVEMRTIALPEELPVPVPPRPGDLEPIDRERCLELLDAASFVRVAFVTAQGPTVLPVNHLLHGDALYFRTAPGSKLGTAAAGAQVAIEADNGDDRTRTGWSVLVHGRASIVNDPDLIEALHAKPFEPWALPAEQAFWVQVELERVAGRRIVRD
jgi:uncharacterized protein